MSSDDKALAPVPEEVQQENVPDINLPSSPEGEKDPVDAKIEITEDDCYDELGFKFPTLKKWYIITIVFWVQVFMNFNTSIYNNGAKGMAEEFGVSDQVVKVGSAAFLIAYAFGCELWAPWSEEFGRKPVLQLSCLLVNLFQLPVALAPNMGTVIAGRTLGGLSTAGGSVTLGMIADLWEPEGQQYAVAYVVFASVGGSILGPIFGGFLEQYAHWRWCIWIQLILGGVVQLLHLLTVPETRSTILMNRIAKKRREATGQNIWGPDEVTPFRERFSFKEILMTWLRPFRMFLTEPIVLILSLLSGFADALIFMCIHSFGFVYKTVWGFNAVETGLAFVPILVSYFIAWALFIPSFWRGERQRKARPRDERTQYESRLWLLLYTAPLLSIGLIGFAWVVYPEIHWIASMIFAATVGISNYAIYMATIDYMICAYGPYSASATGGNGWARDFLAGVLVLPSKPFFMNIGAEKGMNFTYASIILFCISVPLVAAVYLIYWKGPVMRKRSPFAQQLADAREEAVAEGRRGSLPYMAQERRRSSLAVGSLEGPGSRRSSIRPLY